jgi:hypothetical protein
MNIEQSTKTLVHLYIRLQILFRHKSISQRRRTSVITRDAALINKSYIYLVRTRQRRLESQIKSCDPLTRTKINFKNT